MQEHIEEMTTLNKPSLTVASENSIFKQHPILVKYILTT